MNKFLLIFAGALMAVTAVTFGSSKVETAKAASDPYTDYEVIKETPMVEDFEVLSRTLDPSTFTFDTTNQTITTQGAWFSNFLSNKKIDTTVDYFTLKAHVQSTNSKLGDLSDALVGFDYYYNNENHVTIYLNWATYIANPRSIGGMHFCATVGGTGYMYESETYDLALLPGGSFSLAGNRSAKNPFTSFWADNPGKFTTGENRYDTTHFDVTNNAYVFLDKGFDITLHFENTFYDDRECAVVQIQIDAYDATGTIPMRFFSPMVAIDAFTKPLGIDSPLRNVAPKIGFYTNGCISPVVFSKFEYTKYVRPSVKGGLYKALGTAPSVFTIDNDNEVMSIQNNNFNDRLVSAKNIDYSTDGLEYSCDVKGTIGDVNDAQVGFTYYYDEDNYMIAYAYWNGSTGTIASFNYLFKRGGVTTNLGSYNFYPTSGIFQPLNEFVVHDTATGGITTDGAVRSVPDANFDKFRSQSSILLNSGFTIGVRKTRKTYLNRLCDALQMRVSAVGTDGKVHNWYTPTCFVDVFTQSTSLLIDQTPSIGVYTFNAGVVEFSNFQYGEMSIYPKDPSTYVFGSRVENGLNLTGSNKGKNWSFKKSNLVVSYEDITPDDRLGEVTAFTPNVNQNVYVGAKISVDNIYSDKGYVALYPYYFDENNYIQVSVEYSIQGFYLTGRGKMNGQKIANQDTFFDRLINPTSLQPIFMEAAINNNNVEVYYENLPHPVVSIDLSKQDLSSRPLSGSFTGFGVGNLDATFGGYVANSISRIKPAIPGQTDLPIICENGSRPTLGYVGIEVLLPTYYAMNFASEQIAAKVTVTSPSGATLENPTVFTPNETGYYVVTVTAQDEWLLQATPLNYQISVSDYVPTYNAGVRKTLWQAVFVLSFFGTLIGITIACGIYLSYKNKKEAAKAAILNQKNIEKNQQEAEDEEDEEM